MPNARSKLCNALRGLARGHAGNVAITFALAIIPIIGAVGAAVDYSRANSVKVAMQAAIDSTALMLSRDAPTLSGDQLNARALAYFKAAFNRPEAENIKISATFTDTAGSAITIDGSVDVPTHFVGIMGYDKLTVGSSATSKWGTERLRVALVLDNTGSMSSSGKMTALKSATKSLLAQLKSAANNDGDVYVSIIPFNKDVNIGATNYNADWIDWADWDSDNKDCSGGWGSSCTPKNHNTWNGCVTDRDKDYDQSVTPPDPGDATLPPGQASTLFPAEQYSKCPVTMMGLTYNWTGMDSLVDSMQPVGTTNQPIGLVWGWQSLVGGGPLTAPAKDSNYQYREFIVLLSDGLNTENRWSKNQSQVDDRMYKTSTGTGTCANIKAAGITIYTIQVNTSGDPTSTLLQNCASSSAKFYLVSTAADIADVFNDIGTDLTKLRVAK